jgi:hypothetical protein
MTHDEMTHDEMIAVITHHKNGGKIEYRSKLDMTWRDAPNPWWDFDEFDYRVKPEPLVFWAEIMPSRNVEKVSFKQFTAIDGGTIKKFVEVTE